MVTAVDAKNWLGRFDALVAELDGASLGVTQSMCALGRAKLDAAEARVLATEVPADGDTRRAARVAGRGGKRSKAAARKAARRARAVAKNQRLADAMDSGELSGEQVDVIADAMDTDEAAATDQDLIDAIANAPVDQGRKIAADWKRRNTSKDAAESRHQRQRRLRQVRKFLNLNKGLQSITIEGDDVSIEEIWNILTQLERRFYETDGGRDLPIGDHPRTRAQRLFDALHALVTGAATGQGPASSTAGETTGQPAPTTAALARPSGVIVVPIDPDENAELIGHGPIADSAAQQLLLRAGLSVMLVDQLTRDPLWLSRQIRNASAGQFLALVIRDKGCVLCGAPWVGCHAHHLTPWNAPARGETNVDELALVCPGCHTHVHSAALTLVRKPDGTWGTRAALDHELPPDRPGRRDRPDHRRNRDRRSPTGRRRTAPGQPPRSDDQTNPALFDQPGRATQGEDDPDQ